MKRRFEENFSVFSISKLRLKITNMLLMWKGTILVMLPDRTGVKSYHVASSVKHASISLRPLASFFADALQRANFSLTCFPACSANQKTSLAALGLF